VNQERSNPRTQCYSCPGYGYLVSQCPSQTKILFVEVSIEDIEEEEDDEVVVHQQDDDSDVSIEGYEFNGCIKTVEVTGLPPTVGRTQLGVVRCTSAQLEPLNDWRTAIFQTCIKIDNKSCKVIVDSGSCINTVASKLITTLGMGPVKLPNPYKVTWIDATSIDVQILIQFVTYTDNVWCDVLSMDVGHIILGRPWLFDLDVTIYGCTNQCSFVHNGKRVKIMPNQQKQPEKKVDKGKDKVDVLTPEKKGDKD